MKTICKERWLEESQWPWINHGILNVVRLNLDFFLLFMLLSSVFCFSRHFLRVSFGTARRAFGQNALKLNFSSRGDVLSRGSYRILNSSRMASRLSGSLTEFPQNELSAANMNEGSTKTNFGGFFIFIFLFFYVIQTRKCNCNCYSVKGGKFHLCWRGSNIFSNNRV